MTRSPARLCRALLLLAFASASIADDYPRTPPNVLLICVDDLRPEIGAFGCKTIRTPNIDRLAAGGRPFLRHYVQVPTCGASRYSMLTGRRPSKGPSLSNGAFESLSRVEGRLPESLPPLFRRAGYRTVSIGKVSHMPDGRRHPKEKPGVDGEAEMPFSWDEVGAPAGKWKTGWSAFFGYADGSGRQRGRSPPLEFADVDDEGYPDGLIAREAVGALGRLKDRRFFLAVGFYKPHLPFNAPKRYRDLYDVQKIALSECPPPPADVDRALSLHRSGELLGNYGGHPDGKRISDAYARELRHAYFACVSYVDAQIGKVLDELDRLDLSERTVVVLWGDHGWHLGDLSLWGKHSTFERALHSPLIIRTPGIRMPGVPARGIVESLDIYPTLASLCGLEAPPGLGGLDVSALLADPHSVGKDAAIGYWRRGGAIGRSLRTERYRLVRWTRGENTVGVELYDHREDPNETHNVAVQRPETVDRLSRRLDSGPPALGAR